MQRKGESLLSPEDTVKWALKLRKTTQSMPYNAGRGLDTISSFVKANQGRWQVYTDSVKMVSNPSGNNFEENPIENFKGTVIEIIIKVANLEEKSISESLDW